MKKILLFILSLPVILYASPVDPDVAQQVAYNFINVSTVDSTGVKKMPRHPKRMARVTKRITETPQYYIYNSQNNDGFVIVAANDIARPILAYSYSNNLDIDNMPDNMRWWLSEYDREIRWAIDQGVEPTEDTQAEWNEIMQAPKSKASEVIVAPLIKTQWSQSTWYNNQCPYDNAKGKRCLTGCVATAMAQIMKYWNHPKIGRGDHSYYHETYGMLSADFENTTYDWNNMPNDLGIFSSSTQINAIATLMYHCGVAVDMDYGVSGSNAFDWWAENAFNEYFWYSDEARLCSKSYYSTSQWENMIVSDLMNERPIFYTGKGDSGGHAFICDGYRSDNYFHFNWGWDEQDGYYSLSALKPSFLFLTTANYTSSQKAIVNLYPKSDTISRYKLEMESEMSFPDSIQVGTDISFTAEISNVGFKTFSGKIYAVAYRGFEEIIADSVYVDNLIPNGYERLLNFHISTSFDLTPGMYYITLQIFDEDRNDLWFVGNDYYPCSKQIIIYNPLELDWDFTVVWKEYHEKWYTGDSIRVVNKVNNNDYERVGGEFTIKLTNKNDENIYQFLETISIDEDPIEPHNYKSFGINGEIKVPDGDYYMSLLYRKDNQQEWQLLPCTEGHENPSTFVVSARRASKLYVILAQRNTSSNWFYMTSDLGTASNKRYQAVDAGSNNLANVSSTGLADKYYWEIESNKLKNGSQYSTWISGNTAIFDATGKELTIQQQSDGTYTFSFIDGAETRYLSLNNTAGNNYFAYYKGTNQIYKLTLVKEGESEIATQVDNTIINIPPVTKVLRNGQLFILRGDKTYTIQGQEVR